jgi:hypothetical protein
MLPLLLVLPPLLLALPTLLMPSLLTVLVLVLVLALPPASALSVPLLPPPHPTINRLMI